MDDPFLRRRADERIQQGLDMGELAPGDESPEQPKPARPQAAGAGGWRSLVEQRIQDGMERGLFDNLHGAGKPLNLEDDALVPEDLRMAFRLLRSNGLAPLWVELNREIRDDIERLGRFRAYVRQRWEIIHQIQRDHYRKELVVRVREINGKILSYNMVAPSAVHLGSLILDDELAKFDSP